MTTQNQTKSDKNAWIYAILLWFFGYLGIHKFYVNKTGWGIAYLLTIGFFGMGIFIDYIILIFVKIKDNDGKELEGSSSLRIAAITLFALSVATIFALVSLLLGAAGAGTLYAMFGM